MDNGFALVSDFDGTISDKDFFAYVADKYFDENALLPWKQYLAGEKTHFDALKEIFSKLRVSEDDFDKFIMQINADEKFFSTAELCDKLSIPVYICSAGCNYYIDLRIGDMLNKYGIKLITNPSFYSRSMGLQMTRPYKYDEFYSYETGIDKKKVVSNLQNRGYKVIYCGDGIPDYGAAGTADVVFAKNLLKNICEKADIKTLKFDDFGNVYNYIKENS
jgi:2,3-diketo-5-methylthio-1-phosphopentane phosphatase